VRPHGPKVLGESVAALVVAATLALHGTRSSTKVASRVALPGLAVAEVCGPPANDGFEG